MQEVLARLELLGTRCSESSYYFTLFCLSCCCNWCHREEWRARAVNSPSKRRFHRSKSREEVVREVPGLGVGVEQEREQGDGELEMQEVEVGTEHLQEFECSVKRKGKRSKNNKGQGLKRDLEGLEQEDGEVEEKQEDRLAKLRTELLTAVRSGNTKQLQDLVTRLQEEQEEEKVTVEDLVNHQFGESKLTSLHLAAKEGHRAVLVRSNKQTS